MGCLQVGVNDLMTVRPDIAAEWDNERNGSLGPKDVSYGSKRKVWWKCRSCGHEWQAQVRNRTRAEHGTGCPVCANRTRKSFRANTDIVHSDPDIASLWDASRNGGLTPEGISRNSALEYWWRCQKCGYAWRKSVRGMVCNHECPRCSGREKVSIARSSSIRYWAWDLNVDIDPSRYSEKSSKRFWWRCEKGHEWKSQANSVLRSPGSGCPYCSNHRLLAGYNDLATLRPDLAAEWNAEKNGSLTPRDVMAGRHGKVWWKCDRGHEWQAGVYQRTVLGTGCPVCAQSAAVLNGNDLATVNPDLAAEWNAEKNGSLTPRDVSTGSKRCVWWRCPVCCFEWQARVSSRTEGHGCPNYRNHPDSVAARIAKKLDCGELTEGQLARLKAAGIDLAPHRRLSD